MNTVHVYKVDKHLVLTGDSKKIRNELKNTYHARWQPDPFNMWLISDTKLKSFLKNKNITSAVTVIPKKCKTKGEKKPKEVKSMPKEKQIYSKQVISNEDTSTNANQNITSKNITSKDIKNITSKDITPKKNIENSKSMLAKNLLDILPQDVTNEVIKNLSNQDIASLLTSTKQLYSYAGSYQDPIKMQAIERELKHVNHNMRKYYKSEILDLKVNDRVTYKNQNYKILTINGNKGGKMVHVDIYGNIIGKELKYDIIKQEKSWGAKTLIYFYWGISLPNNKAYSEYNLEYIHPGILLFDHGPQITDINSIYFRYKTVPTTEPSIEPALNVMVSVLVVVDGMFYHKREYAITTYDDKQLILTYLHRHEEYMLDEIIINKPIKNKEDLLAFTLTEMHQRPHFHYVSNYEYTITKIGGFGEYYQDNSPR